MSGFDLSELLPFYLDETDEHIAALNDALLRLEQDATDARALAEAFRMFHSIKGASVVMGFETVNRLTHHLESLFDQFRCKKRTLDRPVLDLTFRCLDELRDYHRDLRAGEQGTADLAALTPLVIATLDSAAPPPQLPPKAAAPAQKDTEAEIAPEPKSMAPEPELMVPESPASASETMPEGPEGVGVTVVFEPNLPLPDMKARLVLNRLARAAVCCGRSPPPSSSTKSSRSASSPSGWWRSATRRSFARWPTSTAWQPSASTRWRQSMPVPHARSQARCWSRPAAHRLQRARRPTRRTLWPAP